MTSWEKDFLTDADRKVVEPVKPNRYLAAHIREGLTKGYQKTDRYYILVYSLSDQIILERHAQHEADRKDAKELLAIYKSRVAAEKAPTRAEELIARALVTA